MTRLEKGKGLNHKIKKLLFQGQIKCKYSISYCNHNPKVAL